MRNFFYLLLLMCGLLMLYGCPPRCDPHPISLTPIPDSALALVPYQNGDTVVFMHSGGLLVSFVCLRETSSDSELVYDCYDQPESRIDNTTLSPLYPLNSIVLQLAKYDEQNFSFDLYTGRSSAFLNVFDSAFFGIDSFYINDNCYNSVAGFKLHSSEYYNYKDLFGVDSVYYTVEKGILRMTMTNNEYFDLYEE